MFLVSGIYEPYINEVLPGDSGEAREGITHSIFSWSQDRVPASGQQDGHWQGQLSPRSHSDTLTGGGGRLLLCHHT